MVLLALSSVSGLGDRAIAFGPIARLGLSNPRTKQLRPSDLALQRARKELPDGKKANLKFHMRLP